MNGITEGSEFITHIEDAVENILRSMRIKFIREQTIGGYSVDFFLPLHKICIECDGEWYHKNKWKSKMRDADIIATKHVEKILHFRGNMILKRANDVRRIIRKNAKRI